MFSWFYVFGIVGRFFPQQRMLRGFNLFQNNGLMGWASLCGREAVGKGCGLEFGAGLLQHVVGWFPRAVWCPLLVGLRTGAPDYRM